MSRRPLDPSPGVGYAHKVSATPGAFVTTYEWLVHPIPGERPEQGRQDRRVECATCGGKLTVRVSSVRRTKRRQQAWRVSAASAAAIAVLGGLLTLVTGDAEGLRLALAFGAVIAAVTALVCFMRLRMEDGVTMRWPTLTRMRGHMLRWPPESGGKRPG